MHVTRKPSGADFIIVLLRLSENLILVTATGCAIITIPGCSTTLA
jgi:hypothetical protein